MCVGGGGAWWGVGGGMGCARFRKGHAEYSEKSLEGDGHSGWLSECFFIGRATYESYNNVAPDEIYTCFMPSK